MYRKPIEELIAWKDKANRKPLLMIGARQVGKTWLLKEFGNTHFDKIAYFSLDSNSTLSSIFDQALSPSELLPLLSAYIGFQIEPHKTLIVFDEIQTSPRALHSLKYFCEEAREYFIAAAGSTLGVMLHEQTSFPVGKVEFMDIYPMGFEEFLIAVGERQLADFLRQSPLEKLVPFHEKLIRLLKEYMYVGGMPEAVETYAVNKKDFVSARKAQKSILNAYNRDFSKYATRFFSERLRMLWASIPVQLSKENKKFTYSDIKKGARGKDFDVAIQWLKDSSLIAGVNRVAVPLHPLKSYEDVSSYKVFLNDIGLLSAMVDLETKMLVTQNNLFVEFKGALAEQYVFQELRCNIGKTLYYWSKEKTNVEIDFLIQNAEGKAIAIEVKSGINLRAKSLKTYIDKYQPDYSIRTSLANYKVDETNRIIDVPLYAAGRIGELL